MFKFILDFDFIFVSRVFFILSWTFSEGHFQLCLKIDSKVCLKLVSYFNFDHVYRTKTFLYILDENSSVFAEEASITFTLFLSSTFSATLSWSLSLFLSSVVNLTYYTNLFASHFCSTVFSSSSQVYLQVYFQLVLRFVFNLSAFKCDFNFVFNSLINFWSVKNILLVFNNFFIIFNSFLIIFNSLLINFNCALDFICNVISIYLCLQPHFQYCLSFHLQVFFHPCLRITWFWIGLYTVPHAIPKDPAASIYSCAVTMRPFIHSIEWQSVSSHDFVYFLFPQSSFSTVYRMYECTSITIVATGGNMVHGTAKRETRERFDEIFCGSPSSSLCPLDIKTGRAFARSTDGPVQIYSSDSCSQRKAALPILS